MPIQTFGRSYKMLNKFNNQLTNEVISQITLDLVVWEKHHFLHYTSAADYYAEISPLLARVKHFYRDPPLLVWNGKNVKSEPNKNITTLLGGIAEVTFASCGLTRLQLWGAAILVLTLC